MILIENSNVFSTANLVALTGTSPDNIEPIKSYLEIIFDA